jgi:hypothetical protein
LENAEFRIQNAECRIRQEPLTPDLSQREREREKAD